MKKLKGREPRTVEYADEETMRQLARDAVMVWSYNETLRTIRMKGDHYVKARFAGPEKLQRFRKEARRLKLFDWYPSSWAQIFHDMAPRPARLNPSIESAAPLRVTGAWEEKRRTGRGKVNVKEYDMISAYGWAGLRRLPVVMSAKPVRSYKGAGIYLVRIRRFGSVIPPPHLRKVGAPFWVTDEEIEELDLTVDVIRGLHFRKFWEPRKRIEKIIEHITDYKKVLRSYWGSWAAAGGPTCSTAAKSWNLPNILRDTVSAHYIVSRVRNRIAQVARDALHIFVDAVITDARLPTGTSPGEWQLKNRFQKIRVRGAGNWDAPREGVSRHAGRSAAVQERARAKGRSRSKGALGRRAGKEA